MFATMLQLLPLLDSNVNRVKKHRWLGEEDLNRSYKYHLSQSYLLRPLASNKVPLQYNYR
jgi:hypothetical protein